MIHGRKKRKFGRKRKVRSALLKSLALSLVTREKMTTTEAKAKEIRPYVEKLVSKSKDSSRATQRLLVSKIGKKGAKKLIDVIGPRYKERNGGYTRIIKLPNRKTDASKMAYVEFV